MGSKYRYLHRRRRRMPRGFRKARDRANIAQNRPNDLAANEDSDHDINERNARDVVEYRFDSSDDDVPLAVLREGKREAGFTAPDVSIPSSSEAKADDSSIPKDDVSWYVQGNW